MFELKRRWTRYLFIYYLPSALCVFTSWASFLIKPEVVPGRMSLLVTLFLSLTTVLVATITSSPRVGVGISALTAWILLHYVFIVAAIAAYAFQLVSTRFSVGQEAMVSSISRTRDIRFLGVFIMLYLATNIIYWPICLIRLH